VSAWLGNINNGVGAWLTGGGSSDSERNQFYRHDGYSNVWINNDFLFSGNFTVNTVVTFRYDGPTTCGMTYMFQDSLLQFDAVA
jgi:hypothetical protein